MGLSTWYDAGFFKPNYREDAVFNPDIAYFYRGGTKATAAFALGLLLALFATSNPAKGEEREFLALMSLISSLSQQNRVSSRAGLDNLIFCNNFALFLVIKPSLEGERPFLQSINQNSVL
jgi:hypothetical protein